MNGNGNYGFNSYYRRPMGFGPGRRGRFGMGRPGFGYGFGVPFIAGAIVGSALSPNYYYRPYPYYPYYYY